MYNTLCHLNITALNQDVKNRGDDASVGDSESAGTVIEGIGDILLTSCPTLWATVWSDGMQNKCVMSCDRYHIITAFPVPPCTARSAIYHTCPCIFNHILEFLALRLRDDMEYTNTFDLATIIWLNFHSTNSSALYSINTVFPKDLKWNFSPRAFFFREQKKQKHWLQHNFSHFCFFLYFII